MSRDEESEKTFPIYDAEKQAAADDAAAKGPRSWRRRLGLSSLFAARAGEVYETRPEANPKWLQRLVDSGFEENGIKPVPLEARTSTEYNNLFTVFFTSLLCLLPIPTGLLATLASDSGGYGMNLRDASLVILFFSMLTCLPPAFMGLGGLNTGMRQQIQARYCFGLYLVTIPLLLNAATVTGFTLLLSIFGGQTIAALDPDRVSVDVGIVIVSLVAFVVSFLGFKALHLWERWSWIPNLVAIAVAAGCGGKNLHLQSDAPPATASQVLSFGGVIAGYFLTFGGTASDYSVYHNPRGASKLRVFLYMYSAMLLPSVPLLVLGAAIGGALPQVQAWSDAYQVTGIGGVLLDMLGPAGGFGRFAQVLIALSVVGNISISMYSVSLNLQMVVPALARVHRFVFIVVVFAVVIPVAVRAAHSWASSLQNFLSVIGYWAGCFCAVTVEELALVRRMDFASYDHAVWNVARRLPPGVAALAASMVSFALVVPGMAEVWYTGPIAATTGDIGFEMAFVVTALFYAPFRWLEIKIFGHL